jgi:acetyltransferase
LHTSTFNREIAMISEALVEMSAPRPAIFDVTGEALLNAAWKGIDISKVRFREIRADDFSILHTFVHGLSRETAYKRLLSPRMPTDEELHRWAAVDPNREFAVIAVAGPRDDEELVGVARFVIEESLEAADFAIVLADAWQGLGLGHELLSRLISAARRRGLRRLTGETLATNTGMLTLAGRLGFARLRLSGLVTTLRLDLAS